MDDLIAEFLTETNESLGALDLDLVKLEQNPNDKSLLSSIFRLMHTVKGTSGFLGLARLGKVAHHAENLLGLFRDGKLEVTPVYVTLIFESIDRIKEIISGLEETGSEPTGDDSILIEKLDAVYEGRDTVQPAPAPAPEPSTETLQTVTIEPFIPEEQPDEHGFVPVRAKSHPANTKAAAPVTVETKQKADQAAQPAKMMVEEGGEKSSAVAAQTLRVNVDVLENLMTMVSELVLTRNQLLQIVRVRKESEFSTPLQRLNHVVSELQEGVMKTRMQPIGNAWSKLPRIIRDLSMELGKKIDLHMHGENTELDRQVLEMIKDPLTHMVRNSADHGIELPQDRLAAGKPETGTIVLNAFHEGGHIIIEIKDDGKGLNTEKIKDKILKNGLASADEIATMTKQQIHQFVFKAGFSTAEKVTAVSGRGVGMDVVRTNIEKIGGSIEMKSEEGQGSIFMIKIPLTLAIVSSLIVESAGERFAIPQLAVRELVMTNQESDNRIESINGSPVFRLRDKLLPLVHLDSLLKISLPENQKARNSYIVVTQIGAYLFGIVVDRVYDTEEIVVKPVSKILKGIDLFSGNTILGDGSVIMILDPAGIAKATGKLETATEKFGEESQEQSFAAREKTALLLFKAGNATPKAVPLALVARLEQINLEEIEYSDGKPLVQYRNQLMPLVPLYPDMNLRIKETKPVLVFSDSGHSMGLIVDEIMDIIDAEMNVQIEGSSSGTVGSAIIGGKATDVIDIGHYLRATNKNWFKNHGNEPFINNGTGARRILLVDDSPFFRNMLTPLLKVAGYNVTTLESAVEALAVCESGERFDVIISDIEMPEMNGFEFASKLREHKKWKNTPLVALSSHATPQDMDKGREVGFQKYVAKFDKDTLLNTISQTLVEHDNFLQKDAS